MTRQVSAFTVPVPHLDVPVANCNLRAEQEAKLLGASFTPERATPAFHVPIGPYLFATLSCLYTNIGSHWRVYVLGLLTYESTQRIDELPLSSEKSAMTPGH